MKYTICFVFLSILLGGCFKETAEEDIIQWERQTDSPIFRDFIASENYESASDPHVFVDNSELKMIYSGDHEGISSIKLATGNSLSSWEAEITLLSKTSNTELDESKETAFYRKSDSGKHQIYYIGYRDDGSYKAQIFLAESDNLEGPYQAIEEPVISRGEIAGKDVYCITSPSVVEHQGKLYISFIGWDNSPDKVTEVWILGAISEDDGHSWSDFQRVQTRIGMEGQVTKVNENEFIAVRTGEFNDKDAIYYSTATHPFGPWQEKEDPILIKNDGPFEKDEMIAPQITIDPITQKEVLYYTGADHNVGWWIMMARE